ncbi:hypothetical protein B0H14DRAFT_3145832 [Mycena olivaceomarginata]|nr:hypothetical protein B0H14DRAFT_3145832 [Mycena olivaceomarginata]
MPRSINPLLVRSPPTSTNIMHGLPDGCDCCLPQYAFGNHCKLRCESLLSLDWDLSSGICARLQMDLCVVSSLPYDLVLGRDWIQYGCESVADPCFFLSSGITDLRLPQTIYPTPPQMVPTDSDMVDPNFQYVAHNLEVIASCICVDQHLCRWASISAIPMNNTYIKSSNIILDIFLGHYLRVRVLPFSILILL